MLATSATTSYLHYTPCNTACGRLVVCAPRSVGTRVAAFPAGARGGGVSNAPAARMIGMKKHGWRWTCPCILRRLIVLRRAMGVQYPRRAR